jgi:PTH1 family peptidyl-tRNA hydrolase
MVLEALGRRHRLVWKSAPQFEAEVARWDTGRGKPVWLVKPLTFMNDSGRTVGALARYYKLAADEIVAVHDDLTIDLGQVKVTINGSAGGHNGVASLIEHLGEGFARYRLGIGPRQPAQVELTDYVLGKFTPEQSTLVTQKLEFYVAGLELLVNRGIEAAMNQLNRRDQK